MSRQWSDRKSRLPVWYESSRHPGPSSPSEPFTPDSDSELDSNGNEEVEAGTVLYIVDPGSLDGPVLLARTQTPPLRTSGPDQLNPPLPRTIVGHWVKQRSRTSDDTTTVSSVTGSTHTSGVPT